MCWGPEENSLCPLCDREDESSLHLFLHCEVASSVWLRIMVWLDRVFLIPPNLFVHWECWSGGERKKEVKKGLWLIWHTIAWVMWKARNDKIFKGKSYMIEDLVEEIKVLFWRWFLDRMRVLVCLFYEWGWNPQACFERKMVRP